MRAIDSGCGSRRTFVGNVCVKAETIPNFIKTSDMVLLFHTISEVFIISGKSRPPKEKAGRKIRRICAGIQNNVMCRRDQTADPGQDTVIHMAYKCRGERPESLAKKLLTDPESIDM